MEYQFFIFLAPFSVGVLIATGVILALRSRARVARILLYYFFVVIVYLVANTSELLNPTEAGTIAFAKAGHAAFAILPVIWLRFSVEFSRNRLLKPIRTIVPFFIIPVTVIILFYTNSRHGLMWKSVEFINVSGYLTLRAQYGLGMWVYGIYNDFVYILGILLILQSVFGAMRFFKRQAFVIIAGISIPLVFNVLYALRALPFLRKDFTSVSFAVTAILCFVSISRLQLFKTQPISRNYIFQSMDVGYIVFDSSMQLVDFNDRARDLFDLDESALGRLPAETGTLNSFFQGDFTGRGSERSKTIESNGRYYNLVVSGLNEQDHNYDGFIVSAADTTREVTLAKDLQKAYDELRNAQDIIIQQEKLSTIGQLTAGIAHEINNPLSFVHNNFGIFMHYWKLFTSEVGKSPMNPDQIKARIEEVMKDSEEGVKRVISIVQDLLKFSRPVNSMDNALYDLNQGIETSLIMMGNQIKYISRIVKEKGDIPRAECRETEINQVIINLLSNAVHAVKARKETGEPDYRPRITIRTWSDDDSVFCSISNNGIPILKKDLPNLFKPFFTTKKSSEGTGLGLTICRDIIEVQYGGFLRAETDEETSFVFSIPLVNRKRVNRDSENEYREEG